MHCLICKKDVAKADQYYPFCSARCRDIDLGNWLGESYSVPTNEPVKEKDLEENLK